ncbi:hypothetical protein AAEX28_14115 [Lentisphaerota bacterium WC36G]|nr:hypothetical protein LJT99_00865 [Lentisphaerae bacterium WC36]
MVGGSAEDISSKADFNFKIKQTKISVSIAIGKFKISLEKNGKYSSLRLTKYGFSIFKHNSGMSSNSQKHLFASKSYSAPISLNPIRSLFMKKSNRKFLNAIKAFIDDDDKTALKLLENANKSIDASFMRGVIEQGKGNYKTSLESFEKVMESPAKLGQFFDKHNVYFKLNLDLSHEQLLPIYFDERCMLICLSMIYSELDLKQDAFELLWHLYSEDYKNLEIILLISQLVVNSDSDKSVYKDVVLITSGIQNRTPLQTMILLNKSKALKILGNYQEACNVLTYALQRTGGRSLNLIHELLYEQALIYELLNQNIRAKKNYERIYLHNQKFKDIAQKVHMKGVFKS